MNSMLWRGAMLACAVVVVVSSTVPAGAVPAPGEVPPVVLAKDGTELYPEGVAIPRHLTDAELQLLAERLPADYTPRVAGERVAPTGPIRCVAEYEPMDGILLAWEPSVGGWTTILTEMARNITGPNGNAIAYICVDTAAERTSVTTTLTNASIDMSRVRFIERTTDTIWIRDYGPRYIYEGGVRAIVDHTYNRPRPNDNLLPSFFGSVKHHNVYAIPLTHGGGNFHLDAVDRGYATRLIANENSGLSDAQIQQYWLDYQALDVTLLSAFPTSIDSTQHLDMWMEITGDDTVMISDWPTQSGTTQDNICDATTTMMEERGYTVTRLPAISYQGTHYTYTNVVICNDVVMLPSYTFNGNATHQQYNAQALAIWQAHYPSKTIVQIPCESIVTFAGVMHCIAMHIPRNLNGENPTVYVRTANSPVSYTPGEMVTIQWSSDDDVSVSNVDIEFSADDGDTWPVVIAAATADDGSHTWTVPDMQTTLGRIRVVGRDADGNTGEDLCDMPFTVLAAPDSEPPVMTLTSLDEGGSVEPGQMVDITWTSSDNVGVDRVDLQASLDGGATWPIAIATAIADTGSHQWTVPNMPSDDARVRIIGYDRVGNEGEDISATSFAILDIDAPVLGLDSPNGGEEFSVGAMVTIEWTSSDNVGVVAVDVFLVTESGALPIVEGAEDTGSVEWTVPDMPTAAATIRVVVRDAAMNETVDESDAPFAIVAPPVVGRTFWAVR